MNLQKYKRFFYPVLVIVLAGLLALSIRYRLEMTSFENQITEIKREIYEMDDELKVLNTEIIHLTSVLRVRELSTKYLPNYKGITNANVINILDVPINPNIE